MSMMAREIIASTVLYRLGLLRAKETYRKDKIATLLLMIEFF